MLLGIPCQALWNSQMTRIVKNELGEEQEIYADSVEFVQLNDPLKPVHRSTDPIVLSP